MARALVLGAVALLLACGTRGPLRASRASSSRGSAAVGGQVVSTVNGRPISVAEVDELVAAGLPPREALRRLQSEQLLMQEAERRGFGSAGAVQDVARRAQVQVLLEAEAAAVSVSAEDVRQAYERERARFERPERRAAVHVLAKLSEHTAPDVDDAARAFAEGMLGPLANAADPLAFVRGIHAMPGAPFQVIAEPIPPVARDGSLAEPFLQAMFSLPAPGVVPHPVRTSFGWHAIRVTQILPAESTPYEAAAEQLRAELLLKRRQQRIQDLVARLRAERRPVFPQGVAGMLARLEL